MATIARNSVPQVSPEEIKAYRRDGAVVLRNAIGKEWLSLLEQGLEEVRAEPGGMSTVLSNRAGEGESYIDQYASLRNARLKEFVAHSPAARIAAELIGHPAHYVLDQVFYKHSGFLVPTAFHQDTPFLRVSGNDLVRTWVCCDSSPRKATISVVRGSHRWNVTYRPTEPERSDTLAKEVGKDFSYEGGVFDPSLPSLPDIENHPDSFELMQWDIEPGDVLAFYGNAIHGAIEPFELPHSRRALAILWGGGDVRYCKRPGHSIPDLADMKHLPIAHDELIADHPEIFPRCWPPED